MLEKTSNKKWNNLKLIKKDYQILYELNNNSRKPVSQIASSLRISKQSADYHITKLLKLGIIKQFYALINFTALGYKPYKIFLRLNNLATKDIKQYLEEFRNTEYVVWTVHCDGKFDVVIGLIAKNTSHFKEIYLNILEKYSLIILHSDYSTIISAHQRKKGFLISKKEVTQSTDFYVDQQTIEITQTDSDILKIISKDSKISILKISDVIGLTAQAARVRLNNLVKKQVILGYSILIDTNKLGYLSYKVLFQLKNLSKKRLDDLIYFLNHYPPILEVINVMGSWDIEIDLEVNDIFELNNTISDIRLKFKDIINSYDTLIKYEEYSYNYYPLNIKTNINKK